MKNAALYLFILCPCLIQAQKLKKEDKAIIANLQQHIQYLSSDKLQGRLAGSEGEKMAADYISAQYKNIGLVPKGTSEYFQYFEINEGKQVDNDSYLILNGNKLILFRDFFPLLASPDTILESSTSLALKEIGTPWFYNIKDLEEENNNNESIDKIIFAKAKEARAKGATALLFYGISVKDERQELKPIKNPELLALPVYFIFNQAGKKYLNDASETITVKLKTHITYKKRRSLNVIGYLDKGAPLTVIIGAHFDHLGHGEDGNSRDTENKGEIHNGADDNASGTAALIELARMIKDSKIRNCNYLFIAFSAEELGLLGSKYFTEHPTVDLSKVNYMINMDMVGRLNDSTHALIVGGYGTSPSWGNIYTQKGKHALYAENLVFHFDSSGTGPSDHTSFYLKDIPVLFYFTGIHSDYHKPTDDYEKINYNGEDQVIRHIYSLVQFEDKQKNKIAFSKTRQAQSESSAHFSVTLGIMPDYAFNGTGIRIDAIIDNRPAQKSGLKAGDIILALGSEKVPSLEVYMEALGKFKKGDTTTVTYSRNNQIYSANVEF